MEHRDQRRKRQPKVAEVKEPIVNGCTGTHVLVVRGLPARRSTKPSTRSTTQWRQHRPHWSPTYWRQEHRELTSPSRNEHCRSNGKKVVLTPLGAEKKHSIESVGRGRGRREEGEERRGGVGLGWVGVCVWRDFQGSFGGRGGPDGISILILIPSTDLAKSQQPNKNI